MAHSTMQRPYGDLKDDSERVMTDLRRGIHRLESLPPSPGEEGKRNQQCIKTNPLPVSIFVRKDASQPIDSNSSDGPID